MKVSNYCQIPEENEKLQSFINALENKEQEFHFKTSGSTGKPKDYYFSFEQLQISAQQTIEAFGLTSRDVLLCPFSMNYVAAKMMVARAFFLGAQLVFVGPTANPLLVALKEQITFGAFVPLQLQNILDQKQSIEKLNTIKRSIIGGAQVSLKLENEIKQKVKSKLFHTYGMTETLTHVAIRKLGANDEQYRALRDVIFKTDSEGKLQIKSPINNEWLKTNDLVVLSGSAFRWQGRADLVINSGGHKISIDALERLFNSQLIENQVFICGLESNVLGEECVMLVDDAQFDLADFDKVKVGMHKYEIPKKLVFLKVFPMLENGKIDRVKLKLLAAEAIGNGAFQNIS